MRKILAALFTMMIVLSILLTALINISQGELLPFMQTATAQVTPSWWHPSMIATATYEGQELPPIVATYEAGLSSPDCSAEDGVPWCDSYVSATATPAPKYPLTQNIDTTTQTSLQHFINRVQSAFKRQYSSSEWSAE